MHFLVVITTVLLILSTTLVILLRLVQARNVTQRTEILATLGVKGASKDVIIAGFLHPYCNAGGGGERVLWCAISYLQRTEPSVICVVYTGDSDPKTGYPIKKEDILGRCKERFGIVIDSKRVAFVHLKKRWLIEDATWKRFTLIGQGIGTALLAVEAMWKLIPDVFLDTHGLAFAYPVVRFVSYSGESAKRLPIVVYIHYPTISASMLKRVESRQTTYANNASVTGSGWKSRAKLFYYRLFSYIYTSCLLTSQPVLLSVNGSWTQAHVLALLSTGHLPLSPILSFFSGPITLVATLLGYNAPKPYRINQPPTSEVGKDAKKEESRVRKIFPPCDVEALQKFGLENRKKVIFSCAQFRPEKDHAKQIHALSILLKEHPELFSSAPKQDGLTEKSEEVPVTTNERSGVETLEERQQHEKAGEAQKVDEDVDTGVQLVLLGSARNKEDLERVEKLQELVTQLGLESYVKFRLNATYKELLHWLSVSSIGISTMVEEHFGIGVVEFMGAGLIPVVHASGGPIMDIVIPWDRKPTGFHADGAKEFASQLYSALTLPAAEELGMRERARESSRRFSTEAFEDGFHDMWKDVKRIRGTEL